jgi:hypothetical protein
VIVDLQDDLSVVSETLQRRFWKRIGRV